jgi:hypothetical protein
VRGRHAADAARRVPHGRHGLRGFGRRLDVGHEQRLRADVEQALEEHGSFHAGLTTGATRDPASARSVSATCVTSFGACSVSMSTQSSAESARISVTAG